MNLDELLLNVKAVTFDTMVCQTEIKTEEDIEELRNQNYRVELTLDAFKEKFDIDPNNVWYCPSFSMSNFYFNKETLAVCPLHLDFFINGLSPVSIDGLYRVIEEREKEVANHQYQGSILTLADAMRIEYFKLLVDKKGTDIPGLYSLFISNYQCSDYGFANLDPDTLSAILKSKTEEDIENTNRQLEELDDVVTIYRGGNSASTPYDKAYSWTLDKNVANFFATRRGSSEAYIAVATVKKEDIIECLLEDSSEEEVLVYPDKIKVEKVEVLKGMEFINDILPGLIPMYQKYRDMMHNIDFNMDSSIHGKEHQARVLLHCLIISEMLGLPNSDRKILATASIYHDTQRTHDYVEKGHGKAARDYYVEDSVKPNPIVEFLCEYHCLPDKQGYEEIRNNRKLSKNREKSTLLYKIFKDADGLDRIRLGGIREIDVNQLRLDVSKELTLVARIMYEQIRVD